MMTQSDPRGPIIIGMIVLAALMLGGMVWAVATASERTGDDGKYDANVSFIDDGDPKYGPDDAKVTIRIFEDFQCPACKTAHRGLDYVKRTYGDAVRLIWNDFPLEGSHPNARLASNAARCAEEQGKFWEYGDALYDAQLQWTNERDPSAFFISYAKTIQLNEAAFTVCMDEHRYNQKIQNDVKEGIANRVDVTPTFFVNNKRYTGALASSDWDRVLQPLLGDVEVLKEQAEPELIEGAEPIELNL